VPKKIPPLVLMMPLPPAPDHVSGAQLGWRKRVIESERSAEHRTLTEHARVRVLVGIVHGRALVELIPAALGILVDVGAIANRIVISDIEARWDKTIEPGRMQIEIAPAVPPLRRIGATTRQRIRERTIDRWAAARTGA
jgi:hypothetical protein